MVDYFNPEGIATADGNVAPNGVPQQQTTNGEDLGMAEISVSPGFEQQTRSYLRLTRPSNRFAFLSAEA
jgi:hypothetical protein